MLKKIYNTDNSAEIMDLLILDIKNMELTLSYVYNKYLPYLWQSNGSIFSVRNKYKKIKKLIESIKLCESRKQDALNTFTLSNELNTYLNKTSEENAKDKLDHKYIFDEKNYIQELKDIKQLIERGSFSSIRINRQSNKYISANLSAIYITLNTGRRLFEIAKTLDVSKSDKTIYYHNLIKKRDKKDNKYKAYLIDEDYDFLLIALQNVRDYYGETFENMGNAQFNTNYQKTFNKFIKRIFTKYEDVNYSKIRDMYSSVAVNKYKTDVTDEELLRKQVLALEIQPKGINR